MANGNTFWPYVHEMWTTMTAHNEKHPGRRAVVRITLRDDKSFLPEIVRPGDDWIVFQTIDDDQRSKVIAVPPTEIMRLEISYEAEAKTPTGFTVVAVNAKDA